MQTRREIDSTLSGLELRDILLYLVPGTVVLFSIFLVPWLKVSFPRNLGGVTGSLAALLAAYSLGQAIYPINYPIRRLLCRNLRGKGKDCDPDAPELTYIRAAEQHPIAHGVDVFRSRSLARFSSAMIVPSLMFGGFAFWHLMARKQGGVIGLERPLRTVVAVLSLLLGVVCALGFAYRYRRYQRRYLDYLDCLEKRHCRSRRQ